MELLRSNTAVIVAVGPFYDRGDGVTIETALTITNERITLVAETDAGSAPTLILDNITGATSGTSNDLNYIASGDNGMMQLELAAADVNRVGRMKLSITDAANHVPVFHHYFVLPQAIFDWLTGVIVPLPSNMTQILGTAVSSPAAAGILDVNVKNIDNDAASASGTVTFPNATLASTANITAGTITTVTNLTNAPTAGDLTATMKASVNAEVDTALADVNLDHLVGTAASIPAIPAGTYIDQMMDDGTAVYDRTTDSLQAIRDQGDAAWITGAGATNPDVLITTTITNLVSQFLWDLTAGSADDNAYNGCRFVITDASTAVQKCVGVVNIYSGATKTMSPLNDPGIFTIANGDAISIMADRALHPTLDNRNVDVNATGGIGIDWGNVDNKTTTNVLSGTTVGVATLVNGLAAGVITAAAIATDAIDADAIADSALDAGAFTAGAANKLADHVLRRKQANVEASANGDSVTDAGSVYGFVQQAQKSNTVDNPGFLTVYETDGVTEIEQIPLDTDAAADPVVGAG